MTNEQILKQAMKKAVENGWQPITPDLGLASLETFRFYIERKFHYYIIFSHDFARHFWYGERDIDYKLVCECGVIYNWWNQEERGKWENVKFCSKCGKKLKKVIEKEIPKWERHLQFMVLEKEPLLYLKKFL